MPAPSGVGRGLTNVFLAEPPRTAYDFRFDLLGFPVRVTPFFWLAAVILGYNLTTGCDEMLGDRSPGHFVLLVVWVVAVFMSILIHELGHALVMRHYGERACIVLYHFGGMAVPDAYGRVVRSGRFGLRSNQIAISLAGPAAQFLLAAAVILGVRLSGHEFMLELGLIDLLVPATQGRPLPSPLLDLALFFVVLPSVHWALLNLLPVYPLDGGQVSRELFVMFRGSSGFHDSLMLSVVVAAAAAFYFFTHGNSNGALLFIMLAVSSFQILQSMKVGGGGW